RAHELISFSVTRIRNANRVDDLRHDYPVVLQELCRVQGSAVNAQAKVRQSSAIPIEDERILIGRLIFPRRHFLLDGQRRIDESVHASRLSLEIFVLKRLRINGIARGVEAVLNVEGIERRIDRFEWL